MAKAHIISKFNLLTGVLWVLVLGVIGYRLTLGVDFSDESFYLVTAKSMLDWGGPGAMCWNLTQPVMALILPFIKLWQDGFHMHNEGIILFLRVLFLCMTALTSVLFTLYTKGRVGGLLAVVVGLLPLTWTPYALPAPSYNTVAENFFFCGLLIFCLPSRWALSAQARGTLSALALAISCIASPFCCLPSLCFLVVESIFDPDEQRQKIARSALLLLCLCGVLTVGLAVFFFHTENLAIMIRFARLAGEGFSESKINNFRTQLFSDNFPVYVVSAVCLIAMNLFRRRNWGEYISLLLLALLTVVIECSQTGMYLQSHSTLAILALFMTIVMLSIKDVPYHSRCAFACSILAGLSATVFSGAGPQAFCVGAFPAVCLGCTEIARSLLEDGKRWARLTAWIFISTCGLVLLHSTVTRIYGMDKLQPLNTLKRVGFGPYKWLHTSQAQLDLLLALRRDLPRIPNNLSNLYVIGPPAVYACTDLKAMDPYMYHANLHVEDAIEPLLRQFYAKKGKPEVIIKVVDRWFGDLSSLDKELLKSGYSPFISNANYTIYLQSRQDRVE